MTETAAIFSEALGRKINYVPIDSETFAGIVKSAINADPYLVQHLSSLGQDLKDGRPAGMNDLVESLTGQPPMDMLEFINRNKIDFA
jgi:NAD(P)H dehydrogenase (quinone)